MGRKRGELPSIAELNMDLDLCGYIVVEAEHRWHKKKHSNKGGQKYIYVKLMNIETGEKTKWMIKQTAREKFGSHTINKNHRQISKHTDETVAKQVQKLTNGNAELISWERKQSWVYVKIKYKCGCIVEKIIQNGNPTPECPICSAKWKTEDAVCKLVEKIAETLYDKDVNLTAHRQHTVHMEVNGEEVNRRYDVAVELTHKHDETIKRWVYIEYNGEQHYRPVNFGNLEEDELMRQFRGNVERDKQKAEYCKENDIPLIVIPYWKKNEIEEILNDKLVSAVYGEACGCWVQYVDKYFL